MKYEELVQLKEILQSAEEIKDLSVYIDSETNNVTEISIGYFKPAKRNNKANTLTSPDLTVPNDGLNIIPCKDNCCDPGFYQPTPEISKEEYAKRTKQTPLKVDNRGMKPEWIVRPETQPTFKTTGTEGEFAPITCVSKTTDPLPDPNVVSVSSTKAFSKADIAPNNVVSTYSTSATETEENVTGVAHLIDRV